MRVASSSQGTRPRICKPQAFHAPIVHCNWTPFVKLILQLLAIDAPRLAELRQARLLRIGVDVVALQIEESQTVYQFEIWEFRLHYHRRQFDPCRHVALNTLLNNL